MKKYFTFIIIILTIVISVCNDTNATQTPIKQTIVKHIPQEQKSRVITHVTLTCYQPVEEQCNSDYLHTADNSLIDLKKLKKGELKWVAISWDLLYLFPMGSEVKITDETTGKCYGTYIVKDKMNKRWDHRMDILIHPDSKERIYEENIRVELV